MNDTITTGISTLSIPFIIFNKQLNIVFVNDSFKSEFNFEPSGALHNFLDKDTIASVEDFLNGQQRYIVINNVLLDTGTEKVEAGCIVSKTDDNKKFISYVYKKSADAKSKEHLQQTIELQRNALRIHALTEKIRHIPLVISQILTINQEEEFFKNVSNFLTNEPELGIKKIDFYILKNKKLYIYKEEGELTEFNDETEYPRIMKIISSQEPLLEQHTIYYSPLIGKQNTFGVIKLILDEFEVKLIFENQLIAQGYIDSLESLAKILGITFNSIILYEKLEELSVTDELTGAYNRRFFDKKIKEEFTRARRYKKDISLLIVDMDNLKEINDTYGHLVGDEALVKLSNTLSSNLRSTDYLCRYGGDEFAIIMPETSGYDAFYKAELLRKLIALEDITLPNGCSFNITVSIGIGEYTENIATEEELIKKADTALYIAKSKGKNTVV